MKKALITGANGFVGSYTVKEFLSQGIEVVAVDIVKDPKRLESNPRLEYFQCDLSQDLNSLIEKFKDKGVDTFVHFAWAGSAGPQRTDYKLQLSNASNTVECLKAAKEIECERFVCAGSIMEYEVESVVHAQGKKPGMGYIYGMGKLIAHCLCKSIATNIGIDLLWPMITNAYGIGELSPRFVNSTLRKIIHGEKLEFTSGIQNYDFVYVSDVAKAFYLISQYGRPFCEYMIGSGQAAPLREFIERMISACDPNAQPIFGNVPYTGENMPIEKFSIEQLVNDCKFKPAVSFEEGTRLTMKWLENLEK